MKPIRRCSTDDFLSEEQYKAFLNLDITFSSEGAELCRSGGCFYKPFGDTGYCCKLCATTSQAERASGLLHSATCQGEREALQREFPEGRKPFACNADCGRMVTGLTFRNHCCGVCAASFGARHGELCLNIVCPPMRRASGDKGESGGENRGERRGERRGGTFGERREERRGERREARRREGGDGEREEKRDERREDITSVPPPPECAVPFDGPLEVEIILTAECLECDSGDMSEGLATPPETGAGLPLGMM